MAEPTAEELRRRLGDQLAHLRLTGGLLRLLQEMREKQDRAERNE